MTVKPYGNPANYMQHPERLPKYWGKLFYPGIPYYGGTYLDLGFMALAPWKALGLPEFPAAPIILRCLSVLSGVLALVLLYSFGRRLGSRWIGAAAALLLMVQSYFCWYCSIIHPDLLMVALGLLALRLAVLHVERGDLKSLLLFSVVVGLTHGTKCGGPWLIPLAVVAVIWGRVRLGVGWRSLLYRVPALVALVGAVSLLSFAASTPYAFIDSYYFAALRQAWAFNLSEPYGKRYLVEWLTQYWESQGRITCVLTLLACATVGIRCFRRDVPVIPVLATVLGLSVLAWYAATMRYLVMIHYVVMCFALSGLLIAWLVSRPLLWLRQRGPWSARLAHLTAAGLIATIIYTGYQIPVLGALSLACNDHNTGIAIGRWARTNLPRESKIAYYGYCYFDPRDLPQAYWGGNGQVYYESLEKERPDYIVLDAGFYDVPYIVELRKTQKYVRGHEGPNSMLFYQDVLDRGSPEVEQVAIIKATLPAAGSTNGYIVRLARLAWGLDDYLIGSEKRVFRYHPEAKPIGNESSLATPRPSETH
jgi:hypothetical protein